ncbi:hypothetical protein [Acinetobacter guillouiae]|uniref:Uncharacterized protein n=1 Tax=Acinetobacter guillouiae NIPH 991 TaxID=1217656 RepID=N8YCP3_ACIGI|nr:hypothetical protein [Acinetobacter guillouiae]ENV17065.1 hypothetical protein F964_01762 [Acinetobacter guillouiae NIPH 991]
MVNANFDITIDHAFNGNGHPAFIIKIANQFIEINIYISIDQVEELKKITTDSVTCIQAGESANSPVHWKKADDGEIYILIGEDCESWDIVLTISIDLIAEIITGINDLV